LGYEGGRNQLCPDCLDYCLEDPLIHINVDDTEHVERIAMEKARKTYLRVKMLEAVHGHSGLNLAEEDSYAAAIEGGYEEMLALLDEDETTQRNVLRDLERELKGMMSRNFVMFPSMVSMLLGSESGEYAKRGKKHREKVEDWWLGKTKGTV
jgi:hypothetical protein